MKRLFTNVKVLLASLFVLPASLAMGQYTGVYVMPSVAYPFGITPAAADVSDANDAYDKWKNDFVTASQACGHRRVIFDYYSGGLGATDKSETVSEGIAYGMLLSAYRGDRSLFDDLWGYYNANRNGNGVMNWKIKNCGVKGANGATDAELDAAMALIVASEQWQSDNYANDAKALIKIIREKEFEGLILKPGDQFGGSSLLNPSYFTPAYYRVFKEYDGNATFWDNAADKGYEIIDKADKSNNGVVPDWCNSNGDIVSNNYTDNGANFFFDGVRTPFRSAVDYLWHGDAKAKAYCQKFNTWASNAHGATTAAVGSKYAENGTKLENYHNATFASCFAICAMASETNDGHQGYLNNSYNDVSSINPGYGEYFNASFKAIGLFVMTGNFFLPKQCDAPSLGDDVSFCSGSPVTIGTNVSATSYSWKKDGITISGNSSSKSVSTSGVYEILATYSDGCTARDKITVFDDVLEADFIGVSGPGNITVTDNTLGGVTNYSYELVNSDSDVVGSSTEANYVFTGLANGSYSLTLSVDNAGFNGCSGTSSITKVIPVGNGAGVAIDDFAEANNRGIFAWTGVGSNITPIEKTYCSAADVGGDKECPVFGCGVAEIECSAGDNNPWDAWGLSFEDTDAPYDLTDVPFVSIRAHYEGSYINQGESVSIGVKLQQKSPGVDFSNNSKSSTRIDLSHDAQVFNIDFSDALAGWNNAEVGGEVVGADNITAWNSVSGLQILPFDVDPEFVGTIVVDWIIVGAKGLPAPSFNVLLDDQGYTDYGVYLKDYYPNDPQYAECTIETEGSACYGSVPAWKKEAVICDNSVTLNAESCTAEEVRWYKDGALLGTGDSYSATTGGTYVVELSNQGGITRDTVTVTKSGNPAADFSIDLDNSMGAKFFNNSSSFHTWVWDFDDDANFEDEEAQTTEWDPAYYKYLTEGTYSVKLTVTDTVCGGVDDVVKQIEIVCNAPEAFTLTSSSEEEVYCSGDIVTFSIGNALPKYTSDYEWYFSENVELEFNEDSSSVDVTFLNGSWGNVKFEAYGGCQGLKSSDSLEVAVVSDVVLTGISVDDIAGSTVKASAIAENVDAYEWSLNGYTSYSDTIHHSVKEVGEFELCLIVSNSSCGKEPVEVCETVSIELVGLTSGENVAASYVAYPNPATTGSVEFNQTITNVIVTDMLGNELTTAETMDRLDVSNFSAGVYFIKSNEGTLRVIVK